MNNDNTIDMFCMLFVFYVINICNSYGLYEYKEPFNDKIPIKAPGVLSDDIPTAIRLIESFKYKDKISTLTIEQIIIRGTTLAYLMSGDNSRTEFIISFKKEHYVLVVNINSIMEVARMFGCYPVVL